MLDYLPDFAPIIAIINGVIAVYAVQFKPEQRRIKVILLIVAIGLGSAASISTVWDQHNIIRKKREEQENRAFIRKTISEYIVSSTKILQDLQNPALDDKQTEVAADQWYVGASHFLEKIGPDYLVRFQITNDFPLVMPLGMKLDNQEHVAYWRGISNRSARLQQIISEFSH